MITIELKVEFLFELQNEAEWVRKVPGILPEKNRFKEEFLWIDRNGYVLEIGADFMAAEKLNSYPVKVYRKIPVRFSEEYKMIDKKQ